MKKVFMIVVSMTLLMSVATAANFKVDKKESKLLWKGKKVTGEHFGNLTLKSGQLKLNDKGEIKKGTLVVDMTSMTVTDIEGEYAVKLLNHLKSDDFFSTKKHKVAKFDIESATSQPGNQQVLKGKLTIKGKTQDASVSVKTMVKDGVLKGKGVLTFDRTNFDIRYNSGKFFQSLGDKLIYDEVTVDLDIVARTNKAKKEMKK